ncbi:hypothetical protein BH10BAC2_BH10BAC2_36570 [soil metagenome]
MRKTPFPFSYFLTRYGFFLFKGILTCIFIWTVNIGYSQACNQASEACQNTPYNGSLNLTTSAGLFTAKKTPNPISYAKLSGSVPNTFSDVEYAADCNSSSTDNCDQNVNSLVYDVYYPDKTLAEYEACPLPAVILFHAGGFSECSNFGQPGISTIVRSWLKEAM